jgi:hypothetical protein
MASQPLTQGTTGTDIAQPASTQDTTEVEQPASQPSTQGTTEASQPSSTKAKGLATPFTLPLWLTTSGPWESVDHAVADINRQWALCDDGVGVLHKGSQQNYLTKEHIRIQRKDLYCYQKKTSQCKFRITIESRGVASSWDIAGAGPQCNHPNPKTASQQNAFASHRGIPDDLRIIGIGLRRSGGTTTYILRHLASLYREKYSVDAPFNYQDVYHSINPHGFQQIYMPVRIIRRQKREGGKLNRTGLSRRLRQQKNTNVVISKSCTTGTFM